MRHILVSVALLSLAVGIAGTSPALSQTQFSPTPIEASSPMRQNVDAVVKLLLQGDLQGAAKVLKANSVPGSPAATAADEQIRALSDSFSGGGRQLVEVSKGMMAGEVLVLTEKPGAGPAGLLIRVETGAPHRIAAIQRLGIGRRAR